MPPPSQTHVSTCRNHCPGVHIWNPTIHTWNQTHGFEVDLSLWPMDLGAPDHCPPRVRSHENRGSGAIWSSDHCCRTTYIKALLQFGIDSELEGFEDQHADDLLAVFNRAADAYAVHSRGGEDRARILQLQASITPFQVWRKSPAPTTCLRPRAGIASCPPVVPTLLPTVP
jgi:hypothetical protein